MPFYLEKTGVRSIPFHGGTMVEFQVGYLGKSPGDRWVRYTCSMKKHRSYFRVTLQYTADETHTPFVFDLRFDEDQSSIEIRPDNESATAHVNDEMREILSAIYHLDVEGRQ